MKKTALSIFFIFCFTSIISAQGVIGAGGTYSQTFDAIGITATATLPTGWKIDQGTAYSTGTTATTAAYGTSGTGIVSSTSGGAAVNWANGVTGSSTERSVGFLFSSGYTSPRNLFLQLVNNTGSTITSLSIVFDIEKYRSGSRAHEVTFFVSTDGTNWTAVNGGNHNYPADAGNTVVSNPPLSVNKTVLLTGLSIANNANYYLRWAFTGVFGSTNGQGLGLDNLHINTTYTNYYSKTTGNLNELSNWGTDTDGTGTNPSNFTADYQIFNIQNNATPTIDAAWTVSGRGSMVIVGNGTDAITFTIPSSAVVNAIVDVNNNATLKTQNTTLPSTGNISSGSTLEFGTSGGLTIPDRNYPANLIISGTGIKTWSPSNNRTLSGNLTVTGGTFSYGNGVQLTISGNVQIDAGCIISMGSSGNRIVASGSGRTFTLNGDARVTGNETQTTAATSPFSYQYNNFASYTFAPTSWVSFRSPTTAAVTQGIDGITGSPFGNVEIAAISNLITPGSNTHTFKTNVEIAGILAFPRIAANTSLIINFGSNTVKVGGAIQLDGSNTSTQTGGRTYNMGTSTIELNGTSAQSTLGGTDLPGAFYNLKLNNSAGVTVANAVTVSNMLTLGGNNTYANLSNISGYTGLEYAATTSQTTGSEFGASITNLTINNASGVILGGSKTVNGTLTLTSGKLTLGANDLTIAASGSISGATNAKYVITNSTGVLKQTISASGNKLFPVGNSASLYNPVTLALTAGSTEDVFSVRAKSTFTNAPLNDNYVTTFWDISEAVPGSSDATITLGWTASQENGAFNRASENLHIGRFATELDPDAWVGIIATLGGSDPYTASASGFTAFSEFGVGSDGALPVELTSFSAKQNGSNISLNWKTATEVNNFGFEIQKSSDNSTWDKIGFVQGAGNSNSPKEYFYTDKLSNLNGKFYYRLKQIDNDGTISYSQIVEVENLQPSTYQLSQNYPNPFNPTTTISYQLPVNSQVKLMIYSITGEMVRTLVDENQAAGSYNVTLDASGLASGTYIYRLVAGDFVSTKKLVILK